MMKGIMEMDILLLLVAIHITVAIDLLDMPYYDL